MIQIVGQSYATGLGVEAGKGAAQLLAAYLAEEEKNFGVVGAVLYYSKVAGGYATVANKLVRTSATFERGTKYGLVWFGGNDLFCMDSTFSAASQAHLKSVFRFAISRMCAGKIFDDEDATIAYSAGFAKSAEQGESKVTGKFTHFTSTNGSTVTVNVPSSFPGGTVAVYLNAENGVGGTWTFKVDGVSSGEQSTKYTYGVAALSMFCKRFTGLAPGAHTIVCTVNSITTYAAFDSWAIEAPTPPTVIVPGQFKLNEYGTGETHTPVDADVEALQKLIKEACEEFGSYVKFVSLSSMDHTTHVQADKLHPTAEGHAEIFALFKTALGEAKTVSVGQPSETDTSQTLAGHSKQRQAGQPLETDLAQPLSRKKTRAVGQPSEADLAQPVTHRRGFLVGQPVESDLAQAIAAHPKTKAVGQPVEIDLAQPVAHTKLRTLGQATEVDLAQAVTRAKRTAVGQPAESDLAQAITHKRTRSIGQPAETDVAQAITAVRGGQLGEAFEEDTALGVGRAKRSQVGQPTETDVGLATSHSRVRSAGRPSETDTAQPVVYGRTRTLAEALESDTGLAVTAGTRGQLGKAEEEDAVLPVMHLRRLTIAEALETDAAQALGRFRRRAVGQPVEADVSLEVRRAVEAGIGAAVEVDSALALWRRTVIVGSAIPTVTPVGAATVSIEDLGGARAT